jgi:hypothetical protein
MATYNQTQQYQAFEDFVTQVTQAGAASSHADRDVQDDVTPHAGQDVQPWWEKSETKKESGGAAKMRERPQEEHAGTVGAVGERAILDATSSVCKHCSTNSSLKLRSSRNLCQVHAVCKKRLVIHRNYS